MDTRRTTLIASIVLIALLAVGIGYAYTAYTENAGNNTDVSYVTLTQISDDPTEEATYKFAENVKVKMDTYNEENSSTVYYRLNESQNLTDGNKTYTLQTLGSIILHAEITGGNTHPDLTISVAESTNFNATSNWFYIIGSQPDNTGLITVYATKNTSSATKSWTAVTAMTMTYSENTGYNDIPLNVYYGYDASNVVTKAGLDYMKISQMPSDLVDASLIFMASNDTMDQIVYNANNATSPVQSYIVNNPQNGTRTYGLTTGFASLGFTAPTGMQFKGWSLTEDGDTVLSVTFSNTNPINVYAIYEDA